MRGERAADGGGGGGDGASEASSLFGEGREEEVAHFVERQFVCQRVKDAVDDARVLGFDDEQNGALQGAIAEAMGVVVSDEGDEGEGGSEGGEDDEGVDVTEPCAASLRSHAKALLRSQVAESQQTLLSYGSL